MRLRLLLGLAQCFYEVLEAGVEVNRKMLSEMAISDAEGFSQLVEVAKSKLA